MLDMGFIPDIERICKLIPFTRQTLFFSATMPPEITKLTEQFLQARCASRCRRRHRPRPTSSQRLVKSKSKGWDKRETLRRLIRARKATTSERDHLLQPQGDVSPSCSARWSSTASTPARCMATWTSARAWRARRLSKGKLKLLVASDVAARGLDIPAVSHVFNFDVPITPRTTSTASAAPAAPAARASPSPSCDEPRGPIRTGAAASAAVATMMRATAPWVSATTCQPS
jgi:hypothetical protein